MSCLHFLIWGFGAADDDGSVEVYEGKEGGGVLRGEADAAVGDGGAELRDIGRAVDVDEAGEGVGVVRLEPAEGEDAGEDGIFPAAGGGVQAHGDAAVEYGEQRGVFAVQGVDDEAAQRGAATTGLGADAGGTGAAWRGEEYLARGGAQLQPLLRHGDVDGIHPGME